LGLLLFVRAGCGDDSRVGSAPLRFESCREIKAHAQDLFASRVGSSENNEEQTVDCRRRRHAKAAAKGKAFGTNHIARYGQIQRLRKHEDRAFGIRSCYIRKFSCNNNYSSDLPFP